MYISIDSLNFDQFEWKLTIDSLKGKQVLKKKQKKRDMLIENILYFGAIFSGDFF